jgi:hypothetical protein
MPKRNLVNANSTPDTNIPVLFHHSQYLFSFVPDKFFSPSLSQPEMLSLAKSVKDDIDEIILAFPSINRFQTEFLIKLSRLCSLIL